MHKHCTVVGLEEVEHLLVHQPNKGLLVSTRTHCKQIEDFVY